MKCSLCGKPIPKASSFCKFCVEQFEDEVLLMEAEARMKKAETDGFLTQERVLIALDISQSVIDDVVV